MISLRLSIAFLHNPIPVNTPSDQYIASDRAFVWVIPLGFLTRRTDVIV